MKGEFEDATELDGCEYRLAGGRMKPPDSSRGASVSSIREIDMHRADYQDQCSRKRWTKPLTTEIPD